MKKIIILIITTITLISCEDTSDKEGERFNPQLVHKTEHCRYYCLERTGRGVCKVITCECDEGYTADASTSW